MTVADGAAVAVGNAGAVLTGCYDTSDAQSLQQRTLLDLTE